MSSRREGRLRDAGDTLLSADREIAKFRFREHCHCHLYRMSVAVTTSHCWTSSIRYSVAEILPLYLTHNINHFTLGMQLGKLFAILFLKLSFYSGCFHWNWYCDNLKYENNCFNKCDVSCFLKYWSKVWWSLNSWVSLD